MRRHRWIARAQVVSAVLVLLVAALLSGASAAQAERFRRDRPTIADWGRPPVQVAPVRYADIGGAWDCGGVLVVVFTAKDIVGPAIAREQVAVHRDAEVVVQMFERSGRAHAPDVDGAWLPVSYYDRGDPVSGGDNWKRWPGLRSAEGNGTVVDKARVVRGGIASTAVVIQDGCPG